MMTGSPDHLPCNDCGHEAPDATVQWLDPTTGAPDPDWGEPFCAGCAPPGLLTAA